MLTGHALFRGDNEVDQLNKIINILGLPPQGMISDTKKTNL